jgi:uroporphyrinogen-III decarboxylase
MDMEKKWSDLSWQEKREERFKRWLAPTNVKFISPAAEVLYKQRVTRFIKAIKLEKPDRVPVMLPVGNFPAYYSHLDLHTIMYDSAALRRAWIKFMDDFGDMDYFRGPTLAASGRVNDILDLKNNVYPGHGLPLDASMSQFVEAEYMKADEYDKWLTDPSDYMTRYILPRSAGLFEAFKKLPPLRMIQATGWVSLMEDPDIRRTFQSLMDAGEESKKWQQVIQEVASLSTSRGYASFRSFGPIVGAPFDHFADHLRGTRGIAMDMNRQPGKLHEAMERWLNITIENNIKGAPMTNSPIVMMPIHKGDDTFMSQKQFETFYWPYFKKICLALIEEGLVPMPFAEGKYTHRLNTIADMPRSGVVWYFDQTDMAQAKKVLGGVSCIVGNVPTSVVMTNTYDQVKKYCRNLIEICGPGGGYILAGGASIVKGNIENLRAMMDAAYQFGKY